MSSIKQKRRITDAISLEIDISFKSFFLKTIFGSIPRKIFVALLPNSSFSTLYHERLQNIDKGILTDEEIHSLTRYESQKTDEYYKKKATLLPVDLSDITHKSNRTQKIMPLLDTILKKSSVKSMVNIGCRTDFISCYFADRYPKKTFLSVDVGDVNHMNSYLPQRKNWQFLSGYAYHLFEAGSIQHDLVLFSCTMNCFRKKEIQAYLKIMKTTVDYIVINEPIHVPITPLRPLTLITPLEIPLNETYLGGSCIHGIFGYIHNYIGLFQQAGYDIMYCKLMDSPQMFKQYLLQMICKNPGSN
jgi:hypothetical protein